MENTLCIICGKELAGRQTKYCSKICRHRYQNCLKYKYDKVCEECGHPFSGRKEQRFCSLSCSTKHGNRLRNCNKLVHRPDGYVRLHMPESPLAHKDGYVYVHRMVADERFPFTLPSNFEVHHINGDRSDNRPENLVVTGSHSRHMKDFHLLPGLPAFRKTDTLSC